MASSATWGSRNQGGSWRDICRGCAVGRPRRSASGRSLSSLGEPFDRYRTRPPEIPPAVATRNPGTTAIRLSSLLRGPQNSPASLATRAPPAPPGALRRSNPALSSGLVAEEDQRNASPRSQDDTALGPCRSVPGTPGSPKRPHQGPSLRGLSPAALVRRMPQRDTPVRGTAPAGLSG